MCRNPDDRSSLTRRHLLYGMAGGLLALSLPGCGGSTGSGGTPNGGAITPQTRAAALKAVADYWQSLPRVSRVTNAEAIRAFLAARPEFTDVGVSSDLSIYAYFKDGPPLLVINNEPYDQVFDTRAASPVTRDIHGEPTEIGGAFARLYYMHGAWEGALTDPRKTSPMGKGLREILEAVGGYKVQLEADGNPLGVRVAQMRQPGDSAGEAVLFTGCHGALLPLDPRLPDRESLVLCTDQTILPPVDWTDSALQADLNAVGEDGKFAPRVIYTIVDEAEGPGIWKKIFKYALTPHFVTAYMKFAPNSFWFNNSCMGASQEMADAAFSKGLSCYMGWDQSVYRPNTNQVVRFLFDRIAGANLTTDWPANPLQRPFSWYDLILRDMRARGIDRVPGKDKNENAVAANLQFYVNLDQRNVFGLLAPTISEGQLQGNDLILAGSFGQPNGSLQVTVGGQSMTPAATWDNENEIIVHGLPENGPGVSGDVVVSINGHRSNALRITEWRGRFEVITTGPGSLKTTVTYTLHFRAALKATRDEPNGLARVNLENATAVALSDSTCAFEVDPDGVYETESFKVTQERVGPAEIPFGPADPQRKALMDVVLSGSSQATLQVEFNAFYFVEKDVIKVITFDKQRQQSSSSLSGLSPTTARGLTSMDRLLFRILSGQTPNGPSRYAKFNTMEPINPPDLNAARHASPDR